MSKKIIKDINTKCTFLVKVLQSKQLLAENEKIRQETMLLTHQYIRAAEDLSRKNDKDFEKHTGLSIEEAREQFLKIDPKIKKENKDKIKQMSQEIDATILIECMQLYKQKQQCQLSNLFYEQILENASETKAQLLRDNWSCDDRVM